MISMLGHLQATKHPVKVPCWKVFAARSLGVIDVDADAGAMPLRREGDVDARLRAYKTEAYPSRLPADALSALIRECRRLEELHAAHLRGQQERWAFVGFTAGLQEMVENGSFPVSNAGFMGTAQHMLREPISTASSRDLTIAREGLGGRAARRMIQVGAIRSNLSRC